MADVIAMAAMLWDEYQNDNTLLATLRTERTALRNAIIAGTTTGDIVQGNKNGASYTMRPGFTVQDRIHILDRAIKGIEANVRPSRTQRIIFS